MHLAEKQLFTEGVKYRGPDKYGEGVHELQSEAEPELSPKIDFFETN